MEDVFLQFKNYVSRKIKQDTVAILVIMEDVFLLGQIICVRGFVA